LPLPGGRPPFLKDAQHILLAFASIIARVIEKNNLITSKEQIIKRFINVSLKEEKINFQKLYDKFDVEKLSRYVTVDIGGKASNKKNRRLAVKRYQKMVGRYWW